MNPMELLTTDRNEARSLRDGNADVCFLATTDPDGKAQVRSLVLREINGNCLGIYLNQTSPKWQQLCLNDNYELLLFYPTVLRQYRLSGTMQAIDATTIHANWGRRPAGSKYMDYFYNTEAGQSTPLQSRQSLTDKIEALKDRYPEPEKMTAPDQALGIELVISSIDRLDLSREDRIHDRCCYTLQDGVWQTQLLVP